MRAITAIKLLAFLALIVVSLVLSLGQSRAAGGDAEAIRLKISDSVLRATANGKEASFTILLNDQADLSKAYGMEDKARGWYVYRTLKRHAARTQAPIRALLEARNIPYRAHYVANVIFANGDRSDVETLAARSDVKVIEPNAPSDWLHADRGKWRLARGDRARRQPGQSAQRMGPGVQRDRDRDRQPGHRSPVDAQRTTRALPRLEWEQRRPQLQLVGFHSQRDHSGRKPVRTQHHGAMRRRLARHPHDRHDLG